ncbi:hypothetical protein TCE0_018f06170 [Talaromyces pinophilus]|uniref:NADP-dependent oxidoreductase domain-containing protein n=1 Tax=Talaromyces pinophilus TaxID=128442 RepID=A0A510NX34_TALPI|nr:hypothetical protein TCE0_018f06170 [Talaromyces pinophilus]
MAVAEPPTRTQAAHVNMMTDTIIANLPPAALRSIVRAVLVSYPNSTAAFEEETRNYLKFTTPTAESSIITKGNLVRDDFNLLQSRIRCMLGCGLCFQSLPLLAKIVDESQNIDVNSDGIYDAMNLIASTDGDIVQAVTAIQKALAVSTGTRELSDDEMALLGTLYESLTTSRTCFDSSECDFPFQRGLVAVSSLLGRTVPTSAAKSTKGTKTVNDALLLAPLETKDTFQLGETKLPRIFCGLWQLSSPAWGSAPATKIMTGFARYVQRGLRAFDMADHYGDAEIMFGSFRSAYPYHDTLFAATKYCVFHQMTATRETVQANVTERCQRLGVNKVDLLQFHWQFYQDSQYLDVAKYLQEDERVGMLGLCNFDTEHMQRVIDSGVTVYSNQVQFSLIDSRPVVKLGQACINHNVKLLTYGTLCGGFLAEKWLEKPEPDLYGTEITPSQRKYYTMIRSWGGWELFQNLLHTLKLIGTKHNVSISNVATRWVLDFPYVGAVIVGSRIGISEHVDENIAAFGWSLDSQDQEAIENVLRRSRRSEMFRSMGDCGGEYR